MQYTGLKDKNNQEIYNGDIIQTEEMVHNIHGSFVGFQTRFGVVEYGRGKYLINYSGNGGKELSLGLAYHEVIGNIYENIKLLEKDEDDEQY